MRLAMMAISLLITAAIAAADTPFSISESPGFEPAVAAVSDSSAVVVFETGGRVVWAIPGLFSESPASPAGSDSESAPDVAFLPGSGFVVAWLSDDGTRSRPLARVFGLDGVPVSDPREVGGGGDASDVAVTGNPAGGFVVTWAEFGPPGLENVLVRTFDAVGQPVSAVLRVSVDEDVHNIHPKVAAFSDGSFTVAWGTFTILQSSILARTRSGADGSWDDIQPGASDAAYPSLAAGDGGILQTVWVATRGKKAVWGLRDGGTSVVVGGSDAGPAGMAMHPAGPAAVAWHEGGSGLPGPLRFRFLDALGQPEGDVGEVAADVTGIGSPPGVAIAGGGRVIFVWVDHATGQVYGRWWDDPIVPVKTGEWGSLKGAWR